MNRVVRKIKMLTQLRTIMEHPEGEAALCAVFFMMKDRARSPIKTRLEYTSQALRAADNPEAKEPPHIAQAVFRNEVTKEE